MLMPLILILILVWGDAAHRIMSMITITIRNAEGDGLRLLQANPRSRVLVSLIKGIVGAGNEHLSPLQKRCRQEPGNGANDDFLEKGRAHKIAT
jgi:hypothetical protein